MEIVLRRIFPKKSTCPECGSTNYRRSGNSRHGTLLYRSCRDCRCTYAVWPIKKEVDRGGMHSEIIDW